VLASARRFVTEKDAPVLAAALAAQADVLVTGDRKHFGALMDRDDLPLRVRTPRAFLLEGP
jgi:predicted nucleic acid-binding protein